jgi:hypothetical protein
MAVKNPLAAIPPPQNQFKGVPMHSKDHSPSIARPPTQQSDANMQSPLD